MTPLPLADRTITEVAAALRARETSSRELTDACLARIERDAERLNTFLAVGADAARDAADAADAALARGEGEHRPLLGIPYALKDIFVTRALDDDGRDLPGGLPTTAGSRILEGYRSPYRVVRRGAAARGRRRPAGQDELRRVRDGLLEREQRLRPGAQPVGRVDRARRLVGRLVGGRGRRPGLLRPRHRYRRLDPSAGLADRHGRHEADVRHG